MEHLYKLKDALMDSLDEFDTIKGGKLKMGELESINYITDTIKNIDKICMLEEDDGYSGAGNWEAHINGDYGNSRRNDRRYDNESSYANRGKHYVRGHYSRDDGRAYSMRRDREGRYSRDDGKHHMIERLESMMDDAGSEKEREAIRHCISKIENA